MEKEKIPVQREKQFSSTVRFWSYAVTVIIIMVAVWTVMLDYFVYLDSIDVGGFTTSFGVCSFAGCDNDAVWHVSEIVSDGKVPLNPNYKVDGHSYTSTDTVLEREKDTYLTPTDDGRLKVETETHWNEREVEGRSHSYHTIEGSYCEEHRAEGAALIEKAMRDACLSSTYVTLALAAAAVVVSIFVTVKKKPVQPPKQA